MYNNPKWELSKYQLQQQIKEEQMRILNESINKYKGIELKYSSDMYNDLKKTMECCEVRKSGMSVANVLECYNIPFKRVEDGIILI